MYHTMPTIVVQRRRSGVQERVGSVLQNRNGSNAGQPLLMSSGPRPTKIWPFYYQYLTFVPIDSIPLFENDSYLPLRA
jgi:hypothetical protein